MDSKRRWVGIVLAFTVVVFILLLVCLMNRDKFTGPATQMPATTISPTVEEISLSTDYLIGNDTSSWKKDEDFWDENDSGTVERLTAQINTVSACYTAFYHDLRAVMTDYSGKIIKDVDFVITVTSQKSGESVEYTDDDKDGIIIASGLEPGEYVVMLNPREDMKVPEKTSRIVIREQLECAYLEDIEYFINHPDGNDVAEDNRIYPVSSAESYDLASLTEYSWGIDVSSRNGNIDWLAVSRYKPGFAYIRAGYRGTSDGLIYEDSGFITNVQDAFKAGIKTGAFFFSQAVTPAQAVEEASALIKITDGFYCDMPYMLMIDDTMTLSKTASMDRETRTAVYKAFLETVKNSGFEPGIYISSEKADSLIDLREFEQYAIWLADYNESPTYEGLYSYWQCSPFGHPDGVNQNVGITLDLSKED